MARKKKKQRDQLVKAGILPARGSKPKSGAQLRQIYKHSKPTPETVMRKAEALGAIKTIRETDADGNEVVRQIVPRSFNWNQATEPLDVLLHCSRLPGRDKATISEAEYVAAMRLGYLRFAVLGRRGPSLSQFHMAENISSDHAPDRALTDEEKLEAAERAHERWFDAMEHLKVRAPLSISPLHTLLDGEWPRTAGIRRAIKGLEVLVKLWRIV